MKPSVSVVIPTRNRLAMLRAALASVARQDIAELEAIVINDGGDPVDEIAAEFSDRLEIRFVNTEHKGPAAARNIGIELSRGEYLSFLDDDDMVLPQHLTTALSKLEKAGSDIVATGTKVYADRPQNASDATLAAMPVAARYGFRNAIEMLPAVAPFTTNSVVCRSLRQSGARFDETLETAEDWDMWLRLTQESGLKFSACEAETAVYFRCLDLPSFINSATTQVDGLSALHRSYRRIYSRWPVSAGSAQEVLRELVEEMFDLAMTRLSNGRTNPPFYYENVLPAFSALLRREVRIADVSASIRTELETQSRP